MNERLSKLLEQLEGKLDYQQQMDVEQLHLRSLRYEPVERLPLAIEFPFPQSCQFQPFPHSEAYRDFDKMLYNELLYAFSMSIYLNEQIGDDLPFTIRSNYGTVIMAEMFGAKSELADENPPWAQRLKCDDFYAHVLDVDPYDFDKEICVKVVNTYQRFNEILSDYPNVQRCVTTVSPDMQGPIDTLEMLRGNSLFTDFYERPEMVNEALSLLAKAQVGFARHIEKFITDNSPDYSHEHMLVILGKILVKDDISIMISPEMYREQIRPHDEFVLRELGGGGIHFCGKGEHLLPHMFELEPLKCIDFGQPEMNDVDAIYQMAKERKIGLVRIRLPEEQLLSKDIHRRFPTGVSLFHTAKSFEEAKRIVSAHKANIL